MTRGAKIVVFSVVGLFVLAGIYYGFMAPTTPTEPISDSTPQVSESPTLTMTPAIDGQPLNGMGNALPKLAVPQLALQPTQPIGHRLPIPPLRHRFLLERHQL